jgi:cell division protein FtsI (penicillin-binding protein 3)
LGYRTAGKSGTARKICNGVYQKDKHVAVFAGVVPASNPQFAIVVVVDDPKAEGSVYYGGQVAAPVFSKIAAGALRLFNVPPDIHEARSLRVAQHD